jgi:3-carboxy-cis,cis-muconate cycloisomerase
MPVRDLGWSDGLFESGFGHEPVARAVGWPARVARMVEVEAALARALGRVGLAPPDAVASILQACDIERLDLGALAHEASRSATPVIPLVRALSELASDEGAAHLHQGATSQDIVDTAVMLQVREALVLIEEDLFGLAERLAELADRHRHDVVAGRTLGQQAAPVSFGLQAARWLGATDRHLERVRALRSTTLAVQFGGVVGTLAAYGELGLHVVTAVANELALAEPDLPWHAERDRIVEIAGGLMGVATTAGTIATDLVLGAQTEVGELQPTTGTGPTSSALPHKRNPVDAVAARAASHLAVGELQTLLSVTAGHEQERASGAWQAEWVALPSALVRTAGALRRLRAAVDGMHLDAGRARRNLDEHYGLTGTEALATALSFHLGRPEAQRVAGRVAAAAASSGVALREAAVGDREVADVLSGDDLAEALDPLGASGTIDALVDRALATHRGVRAAESQ